MMEIVVVFSESCYAPTGFLCAYLVRPNLACAENNH